MENVKRFEAVESRCAFGGQDRGFRQCWYENKSKSKYFPDSPQAGVGKTCLVLRYVEGQFAQNIANTIGASFLIKKLWVATPVIESHAESCIQDCGWAETCLADMGHSRAGKVQINGANVL